MNRFTLVKPGADVNHAQITDYIISQDYPAPKISTVATPAHAGIIFVNWASSIFLPLGTTRIIDSFPHGFSYVPTVFATFKFDNGSRKIEGALPLQIGAIGVIIVDADATNIYLKYYSIDLAGITIIPAFTLQARYYVMVERGTI